MKIVCAECKKTFNKSYRTKYCGMDCYIKVAKRNPNLGTFQKGQRPFNKGTKGLMKPNRTSFKKGGYHLPYKPVGTISFREDRSGTKRKFIKTKEPNVWVDYGKYIWLKAGKKIKKGYVLHHKNNNSLDDRLENLIVVSRKEHPTLHNRYNTKNIIGKESKHIVHRNKRRIYLRFVSFIRGKWQYRKYKNKIFIIYFCEECNKKIRTCIDENMETGKQSTQLGIFRKLHDKIIHGQEVLL